MAASAPPADPGMVAAPEASPAAEPAPIQILDFDRKTRKFTSMADHAKEILLAENVADLPIVVVSVAGPFRKGKSFLLNFFLRYLEHQDQENWLGDMSQPLQGFTWRGGTDPETSGIWMWSKLFVRTLPGSGKTVAIALIDTQGTFDNKTTMMQNACIFALNSLLSSHQVYNISGMIAENVLQEMHLFTTFGELAREADVDDSGETHHPFQTLHFLVRDWYHGDDFPCGAEGGDAYVNSVLDEQAEDTTEELLRVRKQLRTCFKEIHGFLMPHPGLKVAQDRKFQGELSVIEPDFLACLREFVPMVLASENLVVKLVSGEEVTCRGFCEYFEEYVKIFQSGDMPNVSTVFDATATVNHLNVQVKALQTYETIMQEQTAGGHIAEERLQQMHEDAVAQAKQIYTSTRKLKCAKLNTEFEQRLDEEISKKYEYICQINQDKNVMRWLKTPLILFGVALLCNILGTVMSTLGLSFVTVPCTWATWIALLAACFYIYSRFYGEYSNIADDIDGFANFFYEAAHGHVMTHVVGINAPAPARSGSRKDRKTA